MKTSEILAVICYVLTTFIVAGIGYLVGFNRGWKLRGALERIDEDEDEKAETTD